ncbi:hypothetical protein SXCC_02306 [Gluconacetobacter sp. SXCC-1]|nr:hypothetical protein SXCC_02306 [Gluconacetobacter sp. SXCC-1]
MHKLRKNAAFLKKGTPKNFYCFLSTVCFQTVSKAKPMYCLC